MLREEIKIEDLGQELIVQLQAVFTSLSSPDALIRLFDALDSLIATDTSTGSSFIHPSSPLGLFVRRCIVSFKLLSFESVVDLFTQILDSKADFESEDVPERPRDVTDVPWKPISTLDLNLSSLILDQGKNHPISYDQDPVLDKVLRDEITILLGRNDKGLPPNATLLQLSNAIRSRNYVAAIDLLHRHHDLMQHSDESSVHQRSLLNLSHLHTSFGHTRMSLDALHESIRMAQQSGDSKSLGECLLALSHIMINSHGAFGPGLPQLGLSTHQSHSHWSMLFSLLSRCLVSGKELQRPDISALARLGLLQLSLIVGGKEGRGGGEGDGNGAMPLDTNSKPLFPNFVFLTSTARDVALMSHMALIESAAGAPSPNPNQPSDAATPPSPPSLSGTYPSMNLLPQPDTSNLSIHICQQLARAAGYSLIMQAHAMLSIGNPLLSFTQAINASVTCKGEDGDLLQALLLKSIEQRNGLGAAMKALTIYSSSSLGSQSQPLAVAILSLKLRLALGDNDLSKAWSYLDDMCALSHLSHCPPPSMEAETLRHCALVHLTSMNYPEAHEAASKMFAISSFHGLQAEAEEALLLLAKVFISSGAKELGLSCLNSLLHHSKISRHDFIFKQALTLRETIKADSNSSI